MSALGASRPREAETVWNVDNAQSIPNINAMGRADRITSAATFMVRPPKRLSAGTTAHLDALKGAVASATRDAVEQHHKARRTVYVLDNDGDLCSQSANGSLRKLSPSELEAALA